MSDSRKSPATLPSSQTPADHPPVSAGKVGVLIVNLGTPDSTSWWDVRRYLKEFLSDRRIIEVNPLLWKLILNLFILSFRPGKAAHAYRKVWLKDTNESPLRYYTRLQSEKLQSLLASRDSRLLVDWAMRYGNPSISSRLQALKNQGCERITVIPLYPQYSATTTATVADEVFRCLMKMRWQPTLRLADPYDAHPGYITALADSISSHMENLDWEPETILASFHGIPQEYFERGDPYYCYCHKTVRLLREKLRERWGDKTDRLQLTFQSRFGPREWLQPYTDKTLEALAQEGTRKVLVICPGFAADCLETLEEIGIAAQESFKAAGGTHFGVVPCLNDSAEHIQLLADISLSTSAGWLPDSTSGS